MRMSQSNLVGTIGRLEVAEEDARTLAAAIRTCYRALAANERPTRKQIACLLQWFSSEAGFQGNTFEIDLNDQKRVADFCDGGGFKIGVRRQDNRT